MESKVVSLWRRANARRTFDFTIRIGSTLFLFRGSCKFVCVFDLQWGDISCNLKFEDAGKLQESKGREGDSQMPKKAVDKKF